MDIMRFLLLSLLIPGVALAALVRTSSSSSYEPGARAIGTTINTEFNNIVDWINGANVGKSNLSALTVATAATTSQTVSSITATTVTGSATLTTTGRPVFVGLRSTSTDVNSGLRISSSSSTNVRAYINIYRDSTIIGMYTLGVTRNASESGFSIDYPTGGIQTIDTGSTAGSHTYSMKVYVFGTNVTLSFIGLIQLYAFEL